MHTGDIEAAVRSRSARVRAAAVASGEPLGPCTLERLALLDTSRSVRLAVARRDALPDHVARVLASDPHWRVRAALVRSLGDRRPALDDDPRSRGVWAYLCGEEPPPAPESPRPDGWDDDPAVMGGWIAETEEHTSELQSR